MTARARPRFTGTCTENLGGVVIFQGAMSDERILATLDTTTTRGKKVIGAKLRISVPGFRVKEGLSCVLFRATALRKSRNLALPWLKDKNPVWSDAVAHHLIQWMDRPNLDAVQGRDSMARR